ncbi:aldehyde dehydrogenase [Acinetobacter sp.]|jgi:gamma-glutamyl-gamma-aminobutyraldehyde dehydrogenase|uniref:aldehyde dehydrogenase n=1 Tax=Acinetobacter sp. TaxID=472 RepID=UPI00281B6459|nr:aldehyde dehydrogenase [Acinetobacter sp.]MDR0237817.1 aldehyde dehydrogenase [Acinetobacter sp.]
MKVKKDWLDQLSQIELPKSYFVAGQYAESKHTYPITNPATAEFMVNMSACDEQEVNQAVEFARTVFKSGVWSNLAPRERKQKLKKLAELIRENAEELALLETLNVGKPIQDSLNVDIPGAASCFEWYAESIDKIYDEIAPTSNDQLAMIRREPMGVVAAIVPWNFPLDLASWKLAPALATGNCVVLKPAEQSPFTALKLAQLAKQAGIPDGVLQVLTGLGHITGQALGRHPDIDCLVFTGSTETAKKFLVYSAESNMKPVWPETGGKSANIIFADADLDQALDKAIFGAFYNQGEVCSANSRILLEHSISQQFIEKFIEKAKNIKIGHPLDPNTQMGCLIDRQHADNVRHAIEQAKVQGAKDYVIPLNLDEDLDPTTYIAPTVLTGVTPEFRIFHQEVFGPVVSITTFETQEEAIELANNSIYGLAASIWTKDIQKAIILSKQLLVGTVSINTVDALDVSTPFGGYKQSGYGRDLSLHAIDKFTQLKTTWIQL